MAGGGGGDERWDDDDDNVEVDGAGDKPEATGNDEGGGSREGKWESGKGRCAVTGRRVLGGTDGLRRVMV